MALNNTYSLSPQPYAPGMVADARLTQTVSRIASAAINAGQAAVRDGNDHKVKPVSAAGDVVIGVVRWEATWVADDGATQQVHAINKDVSVVTDGPVWVTVPVAVTQGQLAYALTDGTGFTNVATAAATRPVGIFDTSTTGAGVAIVNLKPATTAPAA
jgi:hypothetical protein